jgi:hypothetical protein
VVVNADVILPCARRFILNVIIDSNFVLYSEELERFSFCGFTYSLVIREPVCTSYYILSPILP